MTMQKNYYLNIGIYLELDACHLEFERKRLGLTKKLKYPIMDRGSINYPNYGSKISCQSRSQTPRDI